LLNQVGEIEALFPKMRDIEVGRDQLNLFNNNSPLPEAIPTQINPNFVEGNKSF